MEGYHLVEELLVFAVALARVAITGNVISGSGNFEGLAKFDDVKVLPHSFDQRISLCGSSESMLIAFRISLWSRRISPAARSPVAPGSQRVGRNAEVLSDPLRRRPLLSKRLTAPAGSRPDRWGIFAVLSWMTVALLSTKSEDFRSSANGVQNSLSWWRRMGVP